MFKVTQKNIWYMVLHRTTQCVLWNGRKMVKTVTVCRAVGKCCKTINFAVGHAIN